MLTREWVIRNGMVLLPSGELCPTAVRIVGDRIVAVGDGAIAEASPAAEDVDAEGLTLLPGVIDPQVHFREPGLEHKEDLYTATRACARGGVTSFLEMPNTRPLTTTQAALDDKLQRAAQKCLVNYGFFMGATAENLDDLRTAHPACGIKIFMGSNHGALLVDTEAAMEPIFATGDRLIAVHAENQARIRERQALFRDRTDPAVHTLIQDNQTALEATQLALKLSNKYQRRLHILHLSTGEEANLLRREKPAWVTAEVTPQHLVLNVSAYEKIGTLAQMNPPLKSPEDNEILWQALLDGVIDFIATDHAPHTLEEKAQPYPKSPSGMPGVETSLPLMLTQAKAGRCTVAQVAHWMSLAPAQGYNIPNKGLIEPGYDADLVLVDLETEKPVRRQDLQTKCGWSPFEGWMLTGWPVMTWVNGHLVFHRDTFDESVKGRALSFHPGQ